MLKQDYWRNAMRSTSKLLNIMGFFLLFIIFAAFYIIPVIGDYGLTDAINVDASGNVGSATANILGDSANIDTGANSLVVDGTSSRTVGRSRPGRRCRDRR